MMLDSDGPRSGVVAPGPVAVPTIPAARGPVRDLQCRVQRDQAPSQIRYALAEPPQPAMCQAVLTGLPTAVLPVPELVGRRVAPAVARHLPAVGCPFGLDLGGELGVAGLVVAFVGVEVGEALLAAAPAIGLPAGRRAGSAGEGIAGPRRDHRRLSAGCAGRPDRHGRPPRTSRGPGARGSRSRARMCAVGVGRRAGPWARPPRCPATRRGSGRASR